MGRDSAEVENDRYWAQARARAANALLFLDRLLTEGDMTGVRVLEVRVQGPQHTNGEWRAIIKGAAEDGRRLVAFANGGDAVELMSNVQRRCEEAGLPWREDKPYSPKG